jgi:hypothetical protein
MSYIRKITNNDELSKKTGLPNNLKNKHKSLQGALKKYKNEELINQENTIWEKVVKDKYKNN